MIGQVNVIRIFKVSVVSTKGERILFVFSDKNMNCLWLK